MNSGGLPIQEKEFQMNVPWVPVTPEKSIPTRTQQQIPPQEDGVQLATQTWPQFLGIANGGSYTQGKQNYPSPVPNLKAAAQIGLNGECYYNFETRTHPCNGVGLDGIIQLPISNSAKLASADKNLMSIPGPQLSNQNFGPASDPSYSDINQLLVPNQHSQFDKNYRYCNSDCLFHCQGNPCLVSNPARSIGRSGVLPHYGLSIPNQSNYDLNSMPRAEEESIFRDTNSFSLTTLTKDQCKNSEKNCFSSIPSFSIIDGLIQEKEKQQNLVHSIDSGNQQHKDGLLQNIVDSSSFAISTPLKEKESERKDSGAGSVSCFDLNKIPEQKASKRRKHRPKVVVEGNTKRKPKAVSPVMMGSNEAFPERRKYAHRNGLKVAKTTQGNHFRDTTEACAVTASSCRRALNFDVDNNRDESHREVVGQKEKHQETEVAFNIASTSQAAEMHTRRNVICKTNLIIEQDELSVAKYQSCFGDLTHLLSQRLVDVSPQEMQEAFIPFSSNEGRGSKREYSQTLENRYLSTSSHPLGSLLFHQEICQVNKNQNNGGMLQNGISEIQKKLKIGNGIQKNISGRSCSKMTVEDGSKKVTMEGANNGHVNTYTCQLNDETLSCYIEKKNLGAAKCTVDQFTSSGVNLLRQQFLPEHGADTVHLRMNSNCTKVDNFALLTAKEVPPAPPRKTPVPRIKAFQPGKVTVSEEKKTIGSTLSKSGSHKKDDMRPETGILESNQQSGAHAKGAPQQLYPAPIDEIISRLEAINLNGSKALEIYEHNALVPYQNVGPLVPYKMFEFTKKHRTRPKVDLDPETDRIWKLLMSNEASEAFEGNEAEKEKWWEEERKIFQGRADSFIARMHLVQGDRRFSEWKGSVVDSVIGVFLTQNVSDHLSSSAFMSLAARFPHKCTSNHGPQESLCTHILLEEPAICTVYSDTFLTQPNQSRTFLIPNDTRGPWRDNESYWTERSLEVHSQSAGEEIISSQDSLDSAVIQCSKQISSCSGSNLEVEGSRPFFPTFTNLLQAEDTAMFQEFYNSMHGGLLFDEGYSGPNNKEKLNGRGHHNFHAEYKYPTQLENPEKQISFTLSSDLHLQVDSGSSKLVNFEAFGEENMRSWPQNACVSNEVKGPNSEILGVGEVGEKVDNLTMPEYGLLGCQLPRMDPNESERKHVTLRENISQSIRHTSLDPSFLNHQHEGYEMLQSEGAPFKDFVSPYELLAESESCSKQDFPNMSNKTKKDSDVGERMSASDNNPPSESKKDEVKSQEQVHSSGQIYSETNVKVTKSKKVKAENFKKHVVDWDNLRKQVQPNGREIDRDKNRMDSLDYEALRHASTAEISDAIKERGMNNMLAERIKEFLNRLDREHGSVDLEWLRDVPPDKAKDYLLSIRGLGLKSVECVRLLTLQHLAFPVDTNVGRIAVRLGWVPLQPLPESLQLHLLELYPILESIQKYLWPRLCKLDQRTLYELHYQLITFGKVFCTKSKPNCNACPMRAECRHFASAFASARLALPGPEEKSIECKTVPPAVDCNYILDMNLAPLPPYRNNFIKEKELENGNCEPIIEEPATPEQEQTQILESDIEDSLCEDPDEIPTIKLNIKEFTENLQHYMQENMELQEGDMSKALVALNSESASIPTPKLKNISRLRTEHQVYELPDSHPLLERFDSREPDDPSPYLLAIWTPGETANSIEPPENRCGSHNSTTLCNEKTCFSCNSIREANSQTVRGTLLIPCRTAMRGSFPLNGTYFQVNEVFADHDSSIKPIDVPRAWIWNLPRRTVYFGTSVSTIFKGLSTHEIQLCFWRGFVCVRGFDQQTRSPRPLIARLHFPASKLAKTKNEKKR